MVMWEGECFYRASHLACAGGGANKQKSWQPTFPDIEYTKVLSRTFSKIVEFAFAESQPVWPNQKWVFDPQKKRPPKRPFGLFCPWLVIDFGFSRQSLADILPFSFFLVSSFPHVIPTIPPQTTSCPYFLAPNIALNTYLQQRLRVLVVNNISPDLLIHFLVHLVASFACFVHFQRNDKNTLSWASPIKASARPSKTIHEAVWGVQPALNSTLRTWCTPVCRTTTPLKPHWPVLLQGTKTGKKQSKSFVFWELQLVAPTERDGAGIFGLWWFLACVWALQFVHVSWLSILLGSTHTRTEPIAGKSSILIDYLGTGFRYRPDQLRI